MATTLGFWYFMFLPSEAVASFVSSSPPSPAPAGAQRQNGFLDLLPLISHAFLSGCRDIHDRSWSTRTKCTGVQFRVGGFHPVRMDIRVRTCSTRTNRNGLRRPCARAFPPVHTGIRVHACSIRNVCIWFPSFTPLAVWAAGHRVQSALFFNTRAPSANLPFPPHKGFRTPPAISPHRPPRTPQRRPTLSGTPSRVASCVRPSSSVSAGPGVD